MPGGVTEVYIRLKKIKIQTIKNKKRQVERLNKLLPLPVSPPCTDAISNFSLSVDETQMKAVE